MFSYLGFDLKNNLFVAPMAGITDRPFRMLCKEFGAGLAVSEMVTSNSLLYGSEKTLRRANHFGESEPIVVQIAGANPQMLADAANYNIQNGAQIIDINMGCPAKKICNVLAGSALLQNENLVAEICQTVVKSVPKNIPITLKCRLGWDLQNQNIKTIAKIAEDAGIAAIAIHGRTRSQQYSGEASYDLIAEVKQQISIPVIANGDITDARKAKFVLDYTKADALMIGRACQGKPWIFAEISHYLQTGEFLPPPSAEQIKQIALKHMQEICDFYGEIKGVRIARKHIAWYTKGLKNSAQFRTSMNKIETLQEQQKFVADFFDSCSN